MFGRKQPVIGAHTNRQLIRQYSAVQGARAEIPSPVQWTTETTVGHFGRDALLKSIDDSIAAYWKAADGWERMVLLGRLYFLTDYFLKELPRTSKTDYAHRGNAVQTLFMTVVDKLCKAFACTVNYLPQMLEETWGRILTPHGHSIDTHQTTVGGVPTVAVYLAEAKREKYRVRFVGGRAQMHERKNAGDWVVAETAPIGWTYEASIKQQMMEPGYAGFALSMGREFYSAHHRGGFDKDNFFHSSYLAGGAVLCTGTWWIENGIVKAIKNDSGHYQPTIEHLINVVETLQMHGIHPGTIKVTATPRSWSDLHGNLGMTELVLDGSQLLARRSHELAWRRRAHHNQVNIAHRDKSAVQPLPLRGGLPDAPKPPPIPPRR